MGHLEFCVKLGCKRREMSFKYLTVNERSNVVELLRFLDAVYRPVF
jgi:hypothetical protein